MKNFLLLIFFSFTFGFISVKNVCLAEITPNKKVVLVSSGNLDYPPSSWAEGDKIVGVAAELLEKICNEIGITVDSKFVGPWSRVQDMTKAGEVDVVTTIYKTPEREKYFTYFSLPYMDDDNVVWVWKGKEFSFQKWSDLHSKRGGAVIGDSYGTVFDKYIEDKLAIERVTNLALNFKKLEEGRIDYMPYGYYSGLIAASQLGYKKKVVALSQPLLNEGLYLAFSKKSPLVKHLPEMERILRKYIREGVVNSLIEKHLKNYVEKHKHIIAK